VRELEGVIYTLYKQFRLDYRGGMCNSWEVLSFLEDSGETGGGKVGRAPLEKVVGSEGGRFSTPL